MSTNFYAKFKRTNCKCCGQELKEPQFDSVHIGKSSIGWKFTFHGYRKGECETFPEVVIDSFLSWLTFIKMADHLESEYMESISVERILEIIKLKKEGKSHLPYWFYPEIQVDEGNEFLFVEFS